METVTDRSSARGDIAGQQHPRTCRTDAAPHDGRRPGRGQEGAGCQRRVPVRTARSLDGASEPGGIAARAGALPGARRRCEAGKRTHGPGPRACLALLAATALLALAAPAQAQTEVWSTTLTPASLLNGLGCFNGVPNAECSNTSVLSEDSFTYDSTDYTVFQLFVSTDGSFSFIVDTIITAEIDALTLVVGSTSLVLADATTKPAQGRTWASSGVSLTAGTAVTVKLTAPGTTNTAAMGAPTITGTAQVGKTLTAVTTGITDADGLTSPTYTYQWIRVDGTDEEDISGENSSTYTLVDADLGKTIKVKVTFTDDASNAETLTSAATVTVAADTTPPEVESVTVNSTGSTVTLVFDEHLDDDAAGGLHLSAISLTAGGQAVTAPFADFNLQRQTLALTYRYGTIKQGQTVVFSYTDPTAGDDTDTLQDVAGNDVASFTTGQSGVPAVTNNSTNNAATGEPAISGTAQAGQELTADASPIMDTDGLASVSYSYQWVRVDADGTSNEEAISGEIAATYTLTNDDVGTRIKVKVSFTDELSGLEMRTSAAYPSSGTVTAASTTAPALTSVTVTSTPRKTTDTYGAREHIEFSMTFDAPVTVTGDPTFAFDLGGATTASYYAGSGTTTLRFSHAVTGGSSGDQDTNGISWAENAIAFNGGTIAGTDNAVAAVLTHAAQSNLAGHKVDGRTTAVTPATVTDVVVTSTPMLMASGSSTADTYGFGETIVITVTASEAVEVEGDPEFEFSLTDMGGAANDVPATYDRTRSTATTIVFTYTVQAGDRDNNGIWIGDHSRTFMLDANDRIRTASQQIDIDRTHPEKSTHADHKVNGSLGAPTVPPDPTAPTLVSATATTLTIEWTHPGDGGSPLTRNFIEYRVEGTTDWTNWYRGETPTPVTRTVIRNLAAATAYDVRVHATNAIGNSQWVQSATAFSTLAGTAATGAPTITGTAAVGQPLAVDLTGIEDADGLTNVSYSYQWVRVDADGLSNPVDITDATDATYTLVDADLGKTLKVRVSFDDDGGNTETLTSAATATVTPAAGAPSSPTDLSALVGVGQVVLVWQHTSGGGTRSSYEYRSSAGAMIAPDAMWQQVPASTGDARHAYFQVVKGLTNDTTHTLQVRAVNPQGGSPPATVTATPVLQPSCTIDALGDRRRLWQGQLVAGIRQINTDGRLAVGTGTGVEPGTLTPSAFTFRSTTHSVTTWTYDARLNVGLLDQDMNGWRPRDEVVDALRLHVCNTPYDFSDATVAGVFSEYGDYHWNVGLSWPPGIERTLRLSLPPNHAATGDPVISGTVQVGAELTALTDGIMDDDVLDDVFTYQWVRVDADGTSNEEDISDETDATYTLTADDQGKQVKVEVRFVDILGGEETRTSAPTATLAGVPNIPATGAPTITGTAQVGQTLTAATTGITDADGLTTPTYTYQWIRVDGTEADIAGENSSTYILVDADLGTTLTVRVTFADDLGHTETLTSAATATVGAAATGPPTVTDVAVTSTPASGTTYYLAGEVIEFTVTFSAPVTVTATPKFAFRLGAATRQAAYASGSDSAALVFARTVQAGEVDRNGISWNAIALALDGGTITQTGATTAASLTHAEQANLEGHRVDAAPPMQVSASVQGLALVLVYDEPLDPASMPATGAYTVTATVGATTTTPAVSEVSIYGIWVTLTLDARPAAGATVTLAYAPPASNPVQDEAGNDAPAFSGQKVNGAAGNTLATGAPTITGTAQVGQTLTASTTGIADANGLTTPNYTYQWIRVDGTDEADIASANSSTYPLGAADLGTTLKVRVTFADDLGHTETLTSAATATVSAAANILATGAPTITGTAQVGQTLTAGTTAIMDADGLTSVSYTYQWIGVATDNTETNIASATASTYTLVAADQGTTVKVTVRFTDDANNPETRTSAATAAVSAAPNTLATGAPTITGTAQVGQTLTASTTGIADANGLTTPNYTYQWIRVDGTDEADIASANSSTYPLGAADQGTTLKVRVTFADDLGHTETLTSAATATVSAAANTLATGAPTITGTAQVGQTLTAGTTAIMDADGLTSVSYTYQWIGVATDNTETNIASATASTYTLVAADQGTTVKVTVRFTDDANNPETRTSAATATVSAAANTLATGAPTITGTAQVGQTLTAGTTAIMDADGLTSVSYTYQWIRVATDNTETNISSATASTYTLVAADQGTTVKVTVRFTDDANNPETRTSAATAAVSAAPNTPATGAPTITGTAQVGQTLTASTTGIADADGLTSPTYTYQWIRVDGTEADIAAANSSTYILVAADLGTTLKVRVTFADDLGHTETLTSAATATVTATPVTTPGAPQRLRSEPGDAQVTLRWAAPTSDGGSPILRYEYAVDDSGTWIDAGGDLEETVPGLTNGQSYAVAVRAVTAAGAGPAAEVTTSPVTTPAAPQDLRSEPGDAQVTLRWEAPASDGGSPILRYEYAVDDSGTWIDAGGDLEETVPGLTNGQSYAVAVRAVTAAGAGPAAEVTASPVTTPGATQRLRSEPGDAQVTLRWAAPTSDGGSPILRYEYAVDDSGTWIDAGDDLEETVPGLTNGQSYTVAVRAVTAAGAGPAAEVTASPVTTPGAPQRLRSEPGDAQVTLRWAAPTSDGGSPILRYEYAVDDSGTWIDAGGDLEETVPGLTNGQSYAVAVRAVTAAGAGPATEVTASPVTTPGAPQRLRSEPGDAQVTLRWEAPTSDGGSPILRYEYAVDDSGTWIDAGGDLEETVPGLTNGQSYAVAVRAVNAAGAGPAAEVTASPVTTPGAPQRLRSEPGDAEVTLRWAAPASDGGSPILRYEYAVDDSGTWIDAGGDLEETVPGLTNGQSYAVAVRAVNAAGAGPAAEVTASPVTTPGAPQRLRSEPGDAQVTLRWAAPTSDGGSPILRYEYAVDDSGTWIDAGGDLEETVPGLTNGQSYAVAVRAVNAAGAGPATTVTASPITTPGAPQRLRSEPGDAQVTLRWEAPTSDGGSPILRYEYAIDGSETWIDAGGDLEETVRDLTSGQSYAVAVRAVNAAGAGPATTVTSVPADPLPQAWLARFGRTATDHVVDAVSSRWHGGPQASHLTLGGPAEALLGWTGLGGQAARNTAADRGDSVRTERASPRLLAPSGGAGPGVGGTGPGMTVAVTDRTTAPVGLGGVDRHAGAPLRGRAAGRALLGAWGVPDPRALTDLRAALLGSSFLYAGAQDDDGQTRTPGWLGAWSAWGRGAASWFSGADGGASLEGEVATAMLGVDSRWGRWRAGVVASHSRGQGTYTPSTAPGGAVASTLTALHPYAGYDVNARTSVWGVVGYGVGEVSLTPARATTARETDLTNTMAAVGGRTALSVRSGRAGRFELALRSDARLTNTAADAVAGLVGATERTRLVRMMLEGAGTLPLALGGVLTPTVEAGLRYDTGDAETGAGLEVGGGLGYAARRLSVTVNARGLLAHQDTAYEEWGFSGALTVTPSADGRGLSMRLGSGWGATHSGVESLWSRQNAAGLVRHAPVDAAQAYQLEVRYGLDGRQGRARWAPYLGVASGGGSRQALRLGVTLTVGRRLDAGLELGQRQGAPGADPERAAQLRATLRW